MKKSFISVLILGLLFSQLLFAQPPGYVSYRIVYTDSTSRNSGWQANSNEKLVTNPRTPNGYLINCFEGSHTVFNQMPVVPVGETVLIYSTLLLQEGTGYLGLGFRTADKRVYAFEINAQTQAYNLFYHDEAGGENTIIASGVIKADIRNRFAIEITIQKDKIVLNEATTILETVNHSVGSQITHAGYIAGGRAMFRSFSFLFHTPDRLPKSKKLPRPFAIGFDEQNRVFTYAADGLRIWDTESGTSVETLHKNLSFRQTVDRKTFPNLNILVSYTTENSASSGKILGITADFVDLKTGNVIQSHNLKAKDSPDELVSYSDDKIFLYSEDDKTVHIFDVKTGNLLASKKLKLGKNQAIVAITDENTAIVRTRADYSSPISVHFQDITSNAITFQFPNTFTSFIPVAGTSDFIFASVVHTNRNWLLKIDSKSGKVLSETETGGLYGQATLSADKNYLVLWRCFEPSDCKSNFEVFETATGKQRYKAKVFYYSDAITNLAISPDNEYIFTTEEYSLKGRLFNFATGEHLLEIGE